MEVGLHCSMETCKRLDFLPFTCSFCQEVYCKDHSTPDSHNCPAISHTNTSTSQLDHMREGVASSSHAHQCLVPGCGRREQLGVACPRCQRTLCLAHRHPEDHGCSPSLSLPHKTRATPHPKLVTPLPPPKRGGAKSESLAAKVALMKLKQQAEGMPGIPQEERIYYNIMLPAGSRVQIAPLFFSKEWAVGKVVDWVSRKFNINNQNHLPSCSKRLVLCAGNGTVLTPAQPLSSCLDLAPSGASLALQYQPS